MRGEEDPEEHREQWLSAELTTQGRGRLRADLDFLGEARAVVPWVGREVTAAPAGSLPPGLQGKLLVASPGQKGAGESHMAGVKWYRKCILQEPKTGGWHMAAQVKHQRQCAQQEHLAGGYAEGVRDTGFQGWPAGLCTAGQGQCLCGGGGTASWWFCQDLDQGCELTKDLYALHMHC